MKFSHIIFYVPDVVATTKFYEDAFSLKTRFIHEKKCYAEMETGTVALAFASYDLAQIALPEGVLPHSFTGKPQAAEITLETEDVDTMYNHAISQGAVAVTPPTDMPWGQRLSRVKDIDGILVAIGSPMSS